jgi:hypothetical protein
MNNPLKPFEPDHLIRLLHAQFPHRTDVLRALQLCSGGCWESNDYIYFIHSRKAVAENLEIQVVESLVLDDMNKGTIVVDVVADGRIAGIGYLTKCG